MACKKHGTAISRQDKNGHELFVGDFVRAENGKVYQVNKYSNLFNPKTGNTSWKVAGDVEIITEEEYEAALGKGPKVTEAAAFKPEPVEAQIVKESLEEMMQTLEESSDDEGLLVVEPDEAPSLASFTDADILDELRRRGFSGSLSHAVVVYQTVTL